MSTIQNAVAAVPAYKPDERIFQVITDLKQVGFTKIVVVDDGNTPAYADIFRRLKERFPDIPQLRHSRNMGKGRAIRTAFEFILSSFPGEACVTVDCDGQHTAADAARAAVLCEKYPRALVLGCRDLAHGKNVPAASLFGNTATKITVRLLTGLPFSDTQTGLRGYPPEVMQTLMPVAGDRFEFENNSLLALDRLGLNAVEFPIETVYEAHGRHTTTFRKFDDSVNIYRNLLSFHTAPAISFLLCSCIWLLCAGSAGPVAGGLLYAVLLLLAFGLAALTVPNRFRLILSGLPVATVLGCGIGLLKWAGLGSSAAYLALLLPCWVLFTLFYRKFGLSAGVTRFFRERR